MPLALFSEEAKIKGKLLEFAWELKKAGRSDKTIETYVWALRRLADKGGDLNDPESVKEVLARSRRSNTTKNLIAAAYKAFLRVYGGSWNPPEYKVTRKLPFIPLEREIDNLIASCGKKTAALLQLLKETAMRLGEALSLRWADIDFERLVIILNSPEKGGNPRIFNVSRKLIEMLNALPRKSEKVFNTTKHTAEITFLRSRRSAARKLRNPRLLKIHFHTLRHWKATQLYHQTGGDIMFVKEFLGHKRLDATQLYVQLERALFKEQNDEFICKAAKNVEEAQKLIEVGFDYVTTFNGIMLFRKRK